jgi:hypothetical protein
MADLNETQKDMDSSPDGTEHEPEKEWAPIRPEESRTGRTQSRPGSKAASLHSMQRTRSQNGYGCDDDNEENSRDEEQGEEEKDPFEVGWEDGENDPMNPRSKSKAAKWAIVVICSLSSFCV